MKERVYISCGGTGGHFFPGLSLARELKRRKADVRLLLSGVNSLPQSRQAAEYGIDAAVLPRMPSPGKNPLRILQFLWGLAGGFIRCFFLFLFRRPDYIILMGSFASAPAAVAAWGLRVPIYLHDGNARIGKANRFLSRIAECMGTAFPAVNGECCYCELFCIGMPLRPELEAARNIPKKRAVGGLNRLYGSKLRPELYTILIFGGSQGAATINSVLPPALKSLGPGRFQVIHLTGKGKLEETARLYEDAGFPLLLLESSNRMDFCLGSADLVFSRSGGSAVAELLLFGKNAVLIPYPYAAEDHQTDNARFCVESRSAEMVSDGEFTVEKACEIIQRHLDDPSIGAIRQMAARLVASPLAAAAFLDRIAGTGAGK